MSGEPASTPVCDCGPRCENRGHCRIPQHHRKGCPVAAGPPIAHINAGDDSQWEDHRELLQERADAAPMDGIATPSTHGGRVEITLSQIGPFTMIDAEDLRRFIIDRAITPVDLYGTSIDCVLTADLVELYERTTKKPFYRKPEYEIPTEAE